MANPFVVAADTFTALCNPVIRVADAADRSISMSTEYVTNRAKKQSLTDKQRVATETAKELQVLKKELDKDEELKAIYDELIADW